MAGNNNDTSRAESLGFDLNFNPIESLSEEFYDVDTFFNSYIAELAHRTKRQADADPSALPSSKQPRRDPLPAASPGGDLPGMAPPQLLPHLQAAVNPALLQQPGLPQGYQPPGAAAAVPQLSPSPVQLLSAQAAQQQAMAATAATPSAAGSLPQHFAPYFNAADTTGALSGDSGGRHKTSKQQEANKVAQQRYRERKKQKYSEMEATVEALQAQLSQLQTLRQRNQILEGANSDLQKALVAKEGEVERLKGVLDYQADASLEHSGEPAPNAVGAAVDGAGSGPVGCCGPSGAAADQLCVPCDVLPRDLTGIDFKTGFAEQIARLMAFMQEHHLQDADPLGADVARPTLHELAKVVGRCCQLCQAAIRADGVRVLDFIIKHPSQMSSVEDEAEQALWGGALSAIRLSDEQQDQLLLLRQSHLAKLRQIYREREALNMSAMAQMLPHHSRNPAEDNTVEGRMSSVSTCGYLVTARSNAELASVLDSVKDNLRREQRAVMDLNCLTISRILSPVQAACYMVAAYPQHCDALALTNVLARNLGREEAPGEPLGGVGAGASSCC